MANPEPLIRRVYAYVAYRIGDGPDAEDVTSETFERALRYRDSFDSGKGEPAAWLIGIARRRIGEAFATQPSFAADELDCAAEDFSETSLKRLELRDALRVLTESDRELLALRYGADLTARQIADLLELRTNAVEVALHRALERLRGEFERSAATADGEPLPQPVRV